MKIKVTKKEIDWLIIGRNWEDEANDTVYTIEGEPVSDEQVEKEDTCCPVGRRPNSQCHYWDGKTKSPELPEEFEHDDGDHFAKDCFECKFNQLIRYLEHKEK